MCKKLRKALHRAGYVKFEMKIKLTILTSAGELYPYSIPMTFKYPQESFQRAYRNIKKQHRFGK